MKIDGRYFFQIYEAFSFFNLKRGNYKSFPPAAFSTRKFMCIIIILRVIPIPGICIGIGPIPVIVLESVKYVIQVPISTLLTLK